MKFYLYLFLLSLSSIAHTAGLLDEFDDGELRLRLKDPAQELRTTSINWLDLKEKQNLASPSHDSGLPKLRILIDAGHGGRDLGAQGLYGISEKALALKIGRMVKRDLERLQKVKAYELEVKLSREGDTFIPLRDRVKIANEWNADLFVSIHGNSSTYAKAHGFEVYFLSTEATDDEATKLVTLENAGQAEPLKSDVLSILSDVQTTYHISESSRFAETMWQAISLKIRSNGRGVRQGPFTVLHGTTMPAVLVEVGYLTHREEAFYLAKDSYLKRLASAISSGIIEFASQIKKLS